MVARVTEAEAEQMRQLRRDGLSLAEIVAATGRAASAIQKRLKGVPSLRKGGGKSPKRNAARAAGCNKNQVSCECGKPKNRYAKMCIACHQSQRRVQMPEKPKPSKPLSPVSLADIARRVEVAKAKAPEVVSKATGKPSAPPLASNVDCPPHHWLIDNHNYGRCCKEGCGAERQFIPSLRKASL